MSNLMDEGMKTVNHTSSRSWDSALDNKVTISIQNKINAKLIVILMTCFTNGMKLLQVMVHGMMGCNVDTVKFSSILKCKLIELDFFIILDWCMEKMLFCATIMFKIWRNTMCL